MIAALFALAVAAWAGPAARPALEAAEIHDYKTAFRLSFECAKAGDAECMNTLAQLYHDGLGVKADPALSLKWRLASAKKGFPDAQMMLGLAYKNGDGLPVDEKLSKKWFKDGAASLRKLGEQNDTRAQVNLGAMYDEGVGVEKNEKEAAKWYAAAAIQGVQSAQINFAEMTADGRGVPKDDVKAAVWLMVAIDQGENDRWREVYAKVMPRLTAEQVADAQGQASLLKKIVKKVGS